MAVLCVDKSGFAKIGARVTVVTAFPPHPSPLPRGEGEPVTVFGRKPAAGLMNVPGGGSRHREGVFLLPEGEGQDEGESVALSSTGCLDGSTRTKLPPAHNIEELQTSGVLRASEGCLSI